MKDNLGIKKSLEASQASKDTNASQFVMDTDGYEKVLFHRKW